MALVYIDSTLKHDWNLKFNVELCEALEEKGITCHLPQRDSFQEKAKDQVFKHNINAIHAADCLLAVASNESPNWGVEVGYAHGLKKRVVILSITAETVPLMARHMADEIIEVENLDDIPVYIERLVTTLA